MGRWLANISLALFSVVLTLGAIEMALRWLSPVAYATERNMYYMADPYTGYRLSPFGRGQFSGGIPANANFHGHRSDEVSLFKDPGCFGSWYWATHSLSALRSSSATATRPNSSEC